MRMAPWAALTLGLGVACEDPITWSNGACRTDLDCPSDLLCVNGRCDPALAIECPAPVFRPARVDFGGGPSIPRRRQVRIHREDCPIGTEFRIEGPDAEAFDCSLCPGLWSGSQTEVAVWYRPSAPGAHRASLVVAGAGRERRIPLEGRRSEGPRPWVEPPVLDLGWVQGSTVRTVSLFALSPPVGSWPTQAPTAHGLDGLQVRATPEGPVTLDGRPLESAHPHRWTVEFEPVQGRSGVVEGSLRWMSRQELLTELPVRAYTGTPPQALFDETPRRHQAWVGEPVQLGIPVANLGGADLEVFLDRALPWPQTLGTDRHVVAPGEHADWRLSVVPTEAGSRTVSVSIRTNDPDRPQVRLERTIDASEPTSPVGIVQASIRRASGDGWTEDVRAFALEAVFEDGVRVGPGGGAQAGVTWSGQGRPADAQTLVLEPVSERLRIDVRALSDCTAVPGPVLSALLGIATAGLGRAIWGELASGAWGSVADALDHTCLSRGSTRVAVSLRTEADVVVERTVDLQRTGDARTVARWVDGRMQEAP